MLCASNICQDQSLFLLVYQRHFWELPVIMFCAYIYICKNVYLKWLRNKLYVNSETWDGKAKTYNTENLKKDKLYAIHRYKKNITVREEKDSHKK